MQDRHTRIEPLLADLDERQRRALEPGGGHPAIVVPDRLETFPVAGVPPQRPVVDGFDDGEPILQCRIHAAKFLR